MLILFSFNFSVLFFLHIPDLSLCPGCQTGYGFALRTHCMICICRSWALRRVGKRKNEISLVFSFKVQVRLDSQSSEAERLKEIHKTPSAWSVTCLRKFSLLWLVWLRGRTSPFPLAVTLSHVSLFFSPPLWILIITIRLH